MSGPRNGAIDGIKAMAILGTLLIHTSATGLLAWPAGSFSWTADLFWSSVLRCAVPVFLMCSGALFLPESKALTLGTLWRKYILRIFIALAVWSGAYALWNQLVVFSDGSVKNALLDWACFRHKYHLYYLVVLLAVYALLPVLRLLVRHGDRTLLRYCLVLWFLCGSLLPVLFSLPPLSAAEGYVRQYALSFTVSAPGYCLAGYCISRFGRRWPARWYALLYLAGLVLTFGGTWALSLKGGTLSDLLLSGTAPGVTLQALGVFGLGCALWRGRRMPRGVEILSRASFCVYLIHPLFLDIMGHFGFSAAGCQPLWTVPVQSVLLLVLGVLCWQVLRRVPFVRTYLI